MPGPDEEFYEEEGKGLFDLSNKKLMLLGFSVSAAAYIGFLYYMVREHKKFQDRLIQSYIENIPARGEVLHAESVSSNGAASAAPRRQAARKSVTKAETED